MFYDPNYKNQIFWENNDFSLQNIMSKLKEELANRGNKVSKPMTLKSRLAGYGLLGVCVLSAMSTVCAFIVTKSMLFALVALLCFVFFWFGWFSLYLAIAAFVILPRRCNCPVEATCIGYSLSSAGESNRGSLSLSPVFEYEFEGNRFVAYDGVYDNYNSKPSVGSKATIMIDPSEPYELVWNNNRKHIMFLFLAFGFAVVLSTSIFFIVLNDDDFMNEALSQSNAGYTISEQIKG